MNLMNKFYKIGPPPPTDINTVWTTSKFGMICLSNLKQLGELSHPVGSYNCTKVYIIESNNFSKNKGNENFPINPSKTNLSTTKMGK